MAPARAVAQLAILILSPDTAGMTISDLYAKARAAIEAETTLTVAALDVFSESMRQTTIRRCAGDAACFAKAARETDPAIDLLLTISVDRFKGELLLGLRLIDTRAGPSASPELAASGAEVPEHAPLDRALGDSFAELFPRSIWGQVAQLSVEVVPPGAEVQAAGRACVAPCSLSRLPAATHDVVIQKEGYAPWRSAIQLAPHEARRLAVSLEESEKTAWYESGMFWGGVAAVAVTAGMIVAVTVARGGGSDQDVVCIFNRDPAVCDQ